jgi:hypothetical protein
LPENNTFEAEQDAIMAVEMARLTEDQPKRDYSGVKHPVLAKRALRKSRAKMRDASRRKSR